ncbi:MAG: Na+/H+ antiporter subunit E [Gammaproteobacteria bacterium]|nr:Na+/H+ antiporter subunit E [Gammaproteobacteria bacterium]
MLLWLMLVAVWLLLNQSLAPADIILGGLLALLACRVHERLGKPATGRGGWRRGLVVLDLLVAVVTDVIRSNIAVGAIILKAHSRRKTQGFLDIPIDLHHPAALTILACIITATPGTAWAGYDSERGLLTLHILDLVDEEGWIGVIKGRYERRLQEIFE